MNATCAKKTQAEENVELAHKVTRQRDQRDILGPVSVSAQPKCLMTPNVQSSPSKSLANLSA